MGLDWRPGDHIVAFKEEFPANQYPWRRLESKGVKIHWLSVTDPLDRIDQAAKGARLLAISFVQYLTGYRADLNAIGEICRDRGAIFFVDAIQGLGAFPLDVRAAHIDALAADGHKWMLGPGRLRDPLYLARVAGAGRPDRIRLDQRRRLQRLRLPRHDPARRRRPLRMRHVKHHRLPRPARRS